jgi:hypothetical protein
MNSYKLTEIGVNLIEQHIKANIATALADVRTDRADARVTTEVPKSYFQFERARGYDSPAVFTIAEGFDFRHKDGWNYIYGLHDIKVAVLVEDLDRYKLTVKAWRYQAALTKILTQAILQTPDESVKLVVKVLRNTFSGIFSEAADTENKMSVFHKEVVCELEVEHYEQL